MCFKFKDSAIYYYYYYYDHFQEIQRAPHRKKCSLYMRTNE